MEELKKHKIGTLGVVGIIYSICAAGAYGIEDMIPAAGPGMTILMLCILPVIWALPVALTCSELGSAIPEDGGPYVWIQRAFGEFWGFQMGFWRVIMYYVGVPIFVILAGDYVGTMMGWSWGITYAFKLSLILIFGYINWRGISDVAAVSTILSSIIFVAFASVIAIGFIHWHYSPVQPFIPEGQSVLTSASYALAIGMWMYGGYDQMSNVAGELENPQIIPRALMIAIPLIMLTYIPTTIAGLASVGQWETWGTTATSYGDVASLAGPVWRIVFVVVAFLGQVSIFNSYLGSSARTLYMMSKDNLAPRCLSKCSEKYGVPHISLLTLMIACAIFCTFEFSVIATLSVTVMMLTFSGITMTALVLRKKAPDMPRPFKVRMPDWMFNCMCILIPVVSIIALYINGTDYFLFGTAIILAGPFVYWLVKKFYGGLNTEEKDMKTSLNRGDMRQFSILFFMIAILSAGAYFFLPWYEDPLYYEEAYGIPGIFNILITLIGIMAVGSAILGLIFLTLHKKRESKSNAA